MTVESNEDAIFKTRGAYELETGDKVYGSVSGAERPVVVEVLRDSMLSMMLVMVQPSILVGWIIEVF